jgi:hypothetical protein
VDDSSAPALSTTSAKSARWKRVLGWTIVTTAVVLLCVTIAIQDHIRTLRSLRRVPGTSAYVMDYYAGYNIVAVRERGIDVDHVEDSFIQTFFPRWIVPIAEYAKSSYLTESIGTIPTGEHCSTVMLRTSDDRVYFGRNFDYEHDACLILKIHGPDGVESVAVLDLHYLNLDRADLDATNLLERVPLLFAPYYLQDGMNRDGVAVSDMSVKGVKPPYDAMKPSIIHSAAMRLILDYAKTTDEAVELLKQFNIRFVAETCHLMIADGTGKSVVVEFIDGQIKPTTTYENWQVCTNHELCGKSNEENCAECDRYLLASTALAEFQDKARAVDVMNVMQSVSKDNWTMWSSVYDLTSGAFKIAYRRDYARPYDDRIQMIRQTQ